VPYWRGQILTTPQGVAGLSSTTCLKLLVARMADAHQVSDVQSLMWCACDRLDVVYLSSWSGDVLGHAVFA